jgi:pimeloyl-ACP methyl ester carboxylesterase
MEYVTSRDGTRIAFERYGQGPAVVIVPGAFCDHRALAPLAAALASRFTAITYDRRARGASGDAAPQGTQAPEREIEDLDALIAHIGGPAFAVGHSSGCFLAMHAAARGSAITRLALYDPPFPEDPASWDPMTDTVVPRVRELLGQGRRGDAVEFYQTEVIGLPREMVARFRGMPGWSDLEDIAPSLVYEGLIVTDPELPKLPAAIPVPALVIGGEAGFAPASGRRTAEALPQGRYHPLPDQTHDVVPEVLAPILTAYFEEV